MEPRKFALLHLRSIRKAAVDLLEIIDKYRLVDGDLNPRSDAAHFSHSAMGDRLLKLEHALGEWGQLPPKIPTPFLFVNEDQMFEGDEGLDAHTGWSILSSAYWNLVTAKFSGGHAYGDTVPVKVDEEIVRLLNHGIGLLDRFVPKEIKNQNGKIKRGSKATKTRKIDIAITLVVRNPELNDAEVAKQAGCDRSYLTKSKEYQKNAKMARQAMVRQRRQAGFDARTQEPYAISNDPEVDC